MVTGALLGNAPSTARLFLLLIGLVAVERLFELGLSVKNARWARQHGGREFGLAHYPWMVALHATLLIAAPLEVLLLDRPWRGAVGYPALALVLVAMTIRYWAIATLGRRWNTRVLVVPGLPAISSGPYRFLRHPNYAAVILEGAALPLVHGAWITAAAFTLLNAGLLGVRVRCEERALRELSDYESRLSGRPRFLPASLVAGRPATEAGSRGQP